MAIETLEDTSDKIINAWKPTPRQVDFLELPNSIFEALYGGAAGGGKSEMLLMLPIVKRYYQHPLFHGIIFRQSYPMLKESLILRALEELYKPLILAKICKYNAQDHEFKFKSPTGDFDGASIRFSYMEHDDDARKHKSSQFNYVAVDEASEMSKYCLVYISTRIRSKVKELPTIYRLGSNPGGPSHSYLKERFIDPAPNGYTALRDKKTGERRIFIPAKLADNPHLNEKDPTYKNRLEIIRSVSEEEYQALAEGNWNIYSGQVFTEFRDVRQPNEPENACHVLQPKDEFEIPSWWPKILGIDWGFDAHTVAYWGAISPDDRIYIYREYAKRNAYVKEWGADIARLSQYDMNIRRIVLDDAAWHKRGDEKTIVEQFQEASGFEPEKSDKDRLGGKLFVQEYLRWRKKPVRQLPQQGYSKDQAEWILRNYGIERYEDYLKLFAPEAEETNLPKLQIFSSCPLLISTIQKCQYEKRGKDGKSVEDVAEFDGDDSYDCLRYLLKCTGRYFEECKEENEKRRKIAAAELSLKNGGDYNSYVQRMQWINEQHQPAGPVMRQRTAYDSAVRNGRVTRRGSFH